MPEKYNRNLRKQKLSNGLTLLTESMPHVRSIALGIWLNTGSRQESPERAGITHFIEHMVFKGTRHRTAEQIARSMDSIGGHLDAFTAKECVSFNAVVLDQHFTQALDVLSDLVLNPLFDPAMQYNFHRSSSQSGRAGSSPLAWRFWRSASSWFRSRTPMSP